MRTKTIMIVAVMAVGTLLHIAVAGAGERFSDNGDGTVTDHQTGLMWSKFDNQGDVEWQQAERWVKYTFPYTIGRYYDNWRLPTVEELRSLYVADKNYPGYEITCGQRLRLTSMRVKIVPEVQLSCGWVWSSERKSITARVFYFKGGYHHLDRMVHKRGYRALAVRKLE